MEQSESASGTIAASPVARQLDFTGNSKSSVNPSSNSILPEHLQAQLESRFRALAQAKQAHVSIGSRSPPRVAAQTKLPPRKMVMPPKSPQKELSQLAFTEKSVPIHNYALHPTMKRESPESHERSIREQNDVTPKRQKQCNCKNSRCLKLYCECFASQTYCDGCNCFNCHNKPEFNEIRKEAMVAILERRPDAFRPKIASSPSGASDRAVEHNKGCHCKKSTCLKKYCECYQANIPCSEKCKCLDCKNFEGSEERKAHFLLHQPHSLSSIQQATNIAINDAVGSPINKIKPRKVVFDSSYNKQVSSHQLPHQESLSTPGISNFPASIHVPRPNPAVSVRPRYTYRSPLTGILKEEHISDFCNLLINDSLQSAKRLSEEKKSMEAASPVEEKEENKNQQNSAECNGNAMTPSDTDGFERRPLSPVTLALICDERDSTFMDANAQSCDKAHSASGNGLSEFEIEQERHVLSKFCSFLNDLITRGYIRESNVEPESEE